MALLDDLDRRREDELRDRENSARLAQAYANFTTNGTGTLQHEDRVDFGLTFIEKPFVSYASEVDMEQVIDQFVTDAERSAGNEDDDATLPVISGYVTGWDQDDRDFYVGCWLAVRVYYSDADLARADGQVFDPQPEIEHHFTFSAVAMKDIPVDQTDAIE